MTTDLHTIDQLRATCERVIRHRDQLVQHRELTHSDRSTARRGRDGSGADVGAAGRGERNTTMTTETPMYRPGLPPVPPRLRRRPIARGYPVPWFVTEEDGSYDFRVADYRKFTRAVKDQRCWICGERLGGYKAFTLGPMCAVNRTTAEPPSHSECAHWAAVACPFLNQQQSRRREGNLPEDSGPPPGIPNFRQAGVTLVWTTKTYTLFGDGHGGTLIEIGDPLETAWYAYGRRATREEIMASLEGGLPTLRTIAEEEGPRAVKALDEHIARAMRYIPA